MPSPSVAVVIAAFNSASTIHRAIGSALAEKEVNECIVVDDGSTDETATVALGADDGTGRLRVVRLPENRGPAFARNTALDLCVSDYVCVLDADDFFVAGRLRLLVEKLAGDDLLADDIIIVPEHQQSAIAGPPDAKAFGGMSSSNSGIQIKLSDFIRSNIPKRGRPRAELGFLKPIMRRAFLEEMKLRYDPKLRLGEDYAYYARALMAGARFRVVGACGYIAVERSNSLSSRHSIADLAELASFDKNCIANESLTDNQRAAFREHLRATNKNIAFRQALRARAERGLAAGFVTAFRYPSALGYMVCEALYARYRSSLSKLKPLRQPNAASIRLLIGGAGLR